MAALALVLLAAPMDARRFPPSGGDDLKDVLRRAGDWVRRFADDSVSVVAEERYHQEYRASSRTERSDLVSEVVFVRTTEEEDRAGYPWVQFRDVIEVDGTPLPDHRGRLERLFEQAGPSAYAQASALIRESAKYNIGPDVRTVNVPSFALFFLHPRNQRRSRFSLERVERVGPVGETVAITFRERERPTMIKSTDRKDLPAAGTFWIDAPGGHVVRTQLDVQMDRHRIMTARVTYGHDEGIDAWVPQTMQEHYGDPSDTSESLDCTATYSNYRRFRTSGRLIVK